jgi:hybrid cluster-associated redox disulfide protein
MEIKKEMNIGEIIEKHPEVAEVFRELGIGCIGCVAAHFESLEEGFKAHGLSDEDIEKAVKKMNSLVKK